MTALNGHRQESLIKHEIASSFDPEAENVIAEGDCLDTLRGLPSGFTQLIVTSPPYRV